MKSSVIISAIKNKFGIEALNPMQEQMATGEVAPFTMLLSPTGSGKTLAFTIATLRVMAKPTGKVQAVVAVPSRELAMQVGEVMRRVAEGYKTVTFYGGHSMREETQSLSVTPDIIVSTPGRLLDHLQRGQLKLDGLKVLVLDEWDKILQLGFHDDMKKICRAMKPQPAHVILTSATREAELPVWLPVKGEAKTIDFIESGKTSSPKGKVDIIEVPSAIADKLQSLVDLVQTLKGKSVIVFVNYRESAERVAAGLRKAGIPAGLYHGALDQQERQQALELLTNGTTPVLVATDLGSRGIDIDGLDAVVHYHIPLTPDAWTHRNGRTGRMGAYGTVYVITSDKDSIPDEVKFDRQYIPKESDNTPWEQTTASIYINAGKKDKVSRGDIVGYITAHTPLTGTDIGRIALYDHAAIVALPAKDIDTIISSLKPEKLKGKRVAVSRLG